MVTRSASVGLFFFGNVDPRGALVPKCMLKDIHLNVRKFHCVLYDGEGAKS
jgi:hypothetical protein